MKTLLLTIIFSTVFLTSCDIVNKINQSTCDIRRNTCAIERSTDAIEKNRAELEKIRQSQ